MRSLKFKYSIILLLLMFFLAFSSCHDAALFYNESVDCGGFEIAVNRKAGECFAGEYTCTDISETDIVLPDEYDGIPVTALGGFFGRGLPCPFSISLSKCVTTPDDTRYHYLSRETVLSISDSDVTVEDVIFNLSIGKNLTEIKDVEGEKYFADLKNDGSITIYHPVYRITCSEENSIFYSKNGRLYERSTDDLIDFFDYAA